MLKTFCFKWQEITIGGNLNAIVHANLYGSKILSLCEPSLSPFDTFCSFSDLDLEGANLSEGKLNCFERLSYSLALKGGVPFSGKATAVKIDAPSNRLTVITNSALTFDIEYTSLRIFDTEGVRGIPFGWEEKTDSYRVLDWFDVRSGAKHEHQYLEDSKSSFINRVYFYLSPRIDGNKQYKDLMAESILTKEQLHHPDYSDSIARLKVMGLMKQAGIRGTSNGAKQFLPIKIELSQRDVLPIKEIEYKSVGNITIDNRTEEQIIDEWLSSGRNNTSRRATS